MFLQIGEIAEQIPEISPQHKCEYVDQIFKSYGQIGFARDGQKPACRRVQNTDHRG
jgi:hypothetical protein